MNRKITAALLAMLFVANLSAQRLETSLPRFMTQEELAVMKNCAPGKPAQLGITDPPEWPVRTMAEWEELQALVVSWKSYPAILNEIVRAARLETRVIVLCETQTVVDQAKSSLTNAGVDISSNVDFLLSPVNSVWVRDYGPNCVYANDVDSLLIIDWIYNRPTRPKDDQSPQMVASHLNLPLYSTTADPNWLVNTGGNFMSDGMGQAFASKLILDENKPGNQYYSGDQDETEIDEIMEKYMGLKTFIKMETLPFDAIHHIDMHMKLLDEETLLVGQYPSGIADGPQIEANIQYVLSNFKTSFNTPYKVVRIPMPPEGTQYPHNGGDYRTYANAVFVNKTVILPTYEQKHDTTAIRIWQETLPGYTIKPINCNQMITALGAIHCITKEIGVNDPLRIVHKKLEDLEVNSASGYQAIATFQHRSGIQNAKLHWTTDLAGTWNVLDFQDFGTPTDQKFADIPTQPDGSTIYYYIEATANNGRNGVRPMPAPAGYWKFKIKATSGTDESGNLTLQDIFPNPASAITCIPLTAESKTQCSVRLFNSLGQMVRSIFEGEIPAGESKHFLDASLLAGGVYFVEIASKNQRIMRSLVVR